MRVRAGWCNQSPMKSPWGESKTGDSILKGEFVLPASCTTRSRVAWIQWDIKSSNSLFQRYRIFWPEHYLCTGHYIALMYRNVQNPCKTYQISELSAFLIWKVQSSNPYKEGIELSVLIQCHNNSAKSCTHRFSKLIPIILPNTCRKVPLSQTNQ